MASPIFAAGDLVRILSLKRRPLVRVVDYLYDRDLKIWRVHTSPMVDGVEYWLESELELISRPSPCGGN